MSLGILVWKPFVKKKEEERRRKKVIFSVYILKKKWRFLFPLPLIDRTFFSFIIDILSLLRKTAIRNVWFDNSRKKNIFVYLAWYFWPSFYPGSLPWLLLNHKCLIINSPNIDLLANCVTSKKQSASHYY